MTTSPETRHLTLPRPFALESGIELPNVNTEPKPLVRYVFARAWLGWSARPG